MIDFLPRLGLCCVFHSAPIRFRTTTATSLLRLAQGARLEKLAGLCRENAQSLYAAIEFCAANGIGCFRVNSQILPVKTHPLAGYQIGELPESNEIIAAFERCGSLARDRNVRLCFHPDQFVVLNSPRSDVIEKSITDLNYQAEVAEWVGADVINIHAGGAYGDKKSALARWLETFQRLSSSVRKRLSLENDDTSYTPDDLLPLCRAAGIPLVYDVHHHRCLPDTLTIESATELAIATWDREPMFHLSSPLNGWEGATPARHHDYIDPADFPDCWLGRKLTVEVEAKAKEVAVLKLQSDLRESPHFSDTNTVARV